MPESNAEGSHYRTAVWIGVGVFVAIIIFVWWQYGSGGIWSFVKALGIALFIALILFGIIMLVVWLFQTRRIDLVQVHKDRIVEACEMNPAPFSQTLAFRAYGDDFATRTLGKVRGCCMIYAEDKKEEVVTDDGDVKLEHRQSKYARMIFVAYRPKGLLNFLVGRDEVIGGIPQDFSSLTGEIIWLNGMTLSPPLYLIYFLSHHWENRAFIDETIKGNIYRYTLQEGLKDMATIVEDAVAVSPQHKKEQEKQNISTIPIQSIQPKQ